MGYGADGDHRRRCGRTLSPPRATSHPCRRPITSPEPLLEEPLHEHPSTIRTHQDPSSRRRSIDLDHRGAAAYTALNFTVWDRTHSPSVQALSLLLTFG